MTADARDLLERALKLSEDERALLLDALSESIGGTVAPELADELVKRARRVLEGGERGKLASEVMGKLREKHGL